MSKTATQPLDADPTVEEATDLEIADRKPLLGFYEGLRGRIVAAAERRSGRRGGMAADLLLTIPDIFLLLARLATDREVPAGKRALLTAALVYFVAPIDIVPEAVLGVGGFFDDVLLASAVIAEAFGPDLERLAARHWTGPADLRVVLTDISRRANQLLGPRLSGRVQRLLGR